MPQTPILFFKIFYAWGIDIMGSFPVSFGYVYILLTVDYVSKWWKLKLPVLMILKLLQILSSVTHSPGLEFQEI